MMKAKKLMIVLLAVCLMLSAVGCGSVFSAEYYYSEPFMEENAPESGLDTEIRNRRALKEAVLSLVESGESEGQFRFGSYSGALQDDLAEVCLEIKTSTPIGAYAVSDISYNTSRIVSYYTATIKIDYKRSAEEIAAVESISGLAQLKKHILRIMTAHSTETAIGIYSTYASEEYVASLIEDNYYSNPLLLDELPKYTVEAFPDSGPERIYRIEFEYSASEGDLSERLEKLHEKVSELAAQVRATDELNRALSAARLINEAFGEEDEGDNGDTAYACLFEGSDSPMAMAMAYKALCDELGLNCHVVRGQRRDSQEDNYGWNIIGIDGKYYHMDLSRMDENYYLAYLLSDDDMWSSYDWDAEKYPICDGPLNAKGIFESGNVDTLPPATPRPKDSD